MLIQSDRIKAINTLCRSIEHCDCCHKKVGIRQFIRTKLLFANTIDKVRVHNKVVTFLKIDPELTSRVITKIFDE